MVESGRFGGFVGWELGCLLLEGGTEPFAAAGPFYLWAVQQYEMWLGSLIGGPAHKLGAGGDRKHA